MTLEALLGLSADELDNIPEETWKKWLEPSLPHTRPDLQPPKEVKPKVKTYAEVKSGTFKPSANVGMRMGLRLAEYASQGKTEPQIRELIQREFGTQFLK